MKLTQIWVGRFTPEAPKDYFTEVYSEDDEDLPLSRFIGEQGQTWLDHDWLEITKKDTLVPIAELVKYLGHKSKPKVLAKAQELDISQANVLIVIYPDAHIGAPRSVHTETYMLDYMGTYDNSAKIVTMEEQIAKAESGHSKSQAALGSLYMFPAPRAKHLIDYDKAEYWLLKAAEQGEKSTYNRLYHLYYTQSEKHYNPEKAFYWVELAAHWGGKTDLKFCAKMYEKGDGIAENKVLALKWYFLYSCQNENDNYDKDLLSLKSQMSESEIQEAEKLALEWIEAKQYNPDYFRGLKRNPLR